MVVSFIAYLDRADSDGNNDTLCTWILLIGHVSLALENEVGGIWGQEVHILHVDI